MYVGLHVDWLLFLSDFNHEWSCNSTTPIRLHGTYRMNFTFTFKFPWPLWGFLHKLSLDTKLPFRTHSSSSPLQHVPVPWAFYKCCTAILTWWLMDKLVLLLLVARDEHDDVVDEVPPTGWPRDKPALVYSGWDGPNGLWTEDINSNIQHWVIQCL
jgi:hypothetical protein